MKSTERNKGKSNNGLIIIVVLVVVTLVTIFSCENVFKEQESEDLLTAPPPEPNPAEVHNYALHYYVSNYDDSHWEGFIQDAMDDDITQFCIEVEYTCPETGQNVKRLITGGGGVVYKGSGWYVTDYKNKSNKHLSDSTNKNNGSSQRTGNTGEKRSEDSNTSTEHSRRTDE